MRRSLLLLLLAALSACAAQIPKYDVSVLKIHLSDPVYVGMPIWMQIESPAGLEVRYPFDIPPQDFGCNKVEVQRDGVPVPHGPIKAIGPGKAGPMCGSIAPKGPHDRLPLHLRYFALEPGTYMVRYTRHDTIVDEHSDWVPMHVLRPPPEMVEHWLTDTLAHMPTTPGELLDDALPSLLASRDPRVLKLMIDTTYNTQDVMKYSGESLVARYASYALALFDPVQVRAALIVALRQRGPSVALSEYFASCGDVVKSIVPEILADTLPRLRSADPAERLGAIKTLAVLRQPYFGLSTADLAEIAKSLPPAIDSAIARGNEQEAHSLAVLVGDMQLPDGRTLLWKLIDANLAVGQSVICITWYKDPSDLPRLTAMVNKDGKDSGPGELFVKNYGNAARPYLRDILANSKAPFVRASAAKGLVSLNDRAGWTFFIKVVNSQEFYRAEMIQWLRDTFSELRAADDAVILNFLEARIAANPAA